MKIVMHAMELLRILLTITRPYCYTILDMIYRIIFGPKVTLPPIKHKLLLIPATVLAENIRKKKIRAEDVMKAYIERIKEVDPFVNACVDERFHEALKEAKEIDSFLTKNSKPEDLIERDTPLLGVPFSCKEALGVKGLAQTGGQYWTRNRKAPKDCDCAAFYRKAGAIPLVVTNVPEMSAWWETVNTPFGRTFNPYNKLRCAGGSSGGEAALSAYAGGLVGVGNDLLGSIRVPACFNGVYAHKPSPGIISDEGFWGAEIKHILPYLGTGPICRYAKDLPMLATILSEGKIKFDRKVDFSKMKIFYIEKLPGYLLEPTPDVKAAVRKAANYFEQTFGNKPTELYIPELKYAMPMSHAKIVESGWPGLRWELAKSNKNINVFFEFIKLIFRCSEHTLPLLYNIATAHAGMDDECRKFIAMFDVLKEKMDSVMKGGSLLLLPTHPEPATHHFTNLCKTPNKAYTGIWNFLRYPATQIPAGLSDGLPIGIQAVSYVNDDHVTISAAVELEKLFGGWRSPSSITVS